MGLGARQQMTAMVWFQRMAAVTQLLLTLAALASIRGPNIL